MSTFARENFSDQLSIETPEGVALQFPVAGIGSRGIALLVDHILQFLAALLLGLCMYVWELAVGPERFGREMDQLSNLGKWFVAFEVLLTFCLWAGYFALFEAFWHGQTPGKRLMKLRVIKDAGRQITLFESMARNVLFSRRSRLCRPARRPTWPPIIRSSTTSTCLWPPRISGPPSGPRIARAIFRAV